jgi:hypothetical protein
VTGIGQIEERELRQARRALRERGEATDAVLAELRRIVKASVWSGTLPAVLAPYGHWDTEAEQDVYQGWLAERLLREGALQSLLDRARTAGAFRRMAERSLRHWLLNTRERTQAQNLYERVAEMLSSEERFVCVLEAERPAERWWALRAAAYTQPFGAGEERLLEIARSLGNFELVHYRAGAAKHSPLLGRSELLRFLSELLEQAGGALSLALIARAINRRFGLVQISVGELDEAAEIAEEEPGVGEQVAFDELARGVIGELSARQCAVLAGTRASQTLEAMAAEHGCSAATISNEQRRVALVIERYAGEGERHDLLRIVGDALYEAGSEL